MKKINLLILAVVSIFGFGMLVKAEQSCETHTNYYFFLAKNRGIDHNFPENQTISSENTATYSPLPEGATVISEGRVCMTKGNISDGTCDESWTVSDYYDLFKETSTQSPKETTVNGEDQTYHELNKSGNKHYYTGGDYTVVAAITNNKSGMISATYFSNSISITSNASELQNFIKFTVTRSTQHSNFDGVTPISFYWEEEGETPAGNYDTYFNPSAYRIVYKICTVSDGDPTSLGDQDPEDTTTYTATFNYYKYKDNKTTTERLEVTPNPETVSGLANATHNKTLPSLKGCKIVTDKGKSNDNYNFEYTINGKNETFNIYYHCPVEDSGSELPTGDFLIYIAWIVGFGALGYAIHYLIKYNKARKEV